jgi:hypothetical protein
VSRHAARLSAPDDTDRIQLKMPRHIVHSALVEDQHPFARLMT